MLIDSPTALYSKMHGSHRNISRQSESSSDPIKHFWDKQGEALDNQGNVHEPKSKSRQNTILSGEISGHVSSVLTSTSKTRARGTGAVSTRSMDQMNTELHAGQAPSAR